MSCHRPSLDNAVRRILTGNSGISVKHLSAVEPAQRDGASRTCAECCRQIHAHREAEAKERQAEMELLSADPFDPEVQARIAERIRQAQVEENYQNAYEYMPESFSQVTMLYVDMEVSLY